jgi:hypothetical protein
MWVLNSKNATTVGEDRIFDISSFDIVQELRLIQFLKVNHICNILGSICQFKTVIHRDFILLFRISQENSDMFGLLNTKNLAFQKSVLKRIGVVGIGLDPNSPSWNYISKYLFISIFQLKTHSYSFIFYYPILYLIYLRLSFT